MILCQNVFCKRSTHEMYREKAIRTYFHMWLCILPLRGQTWFLLFLYWSSTQLCYYSAFTLWSFILILKEPLYCRGCISVRIPVLLLPDVDLYCPLLSGNHPRIFRTASWGHVSPDFMKDYSMLFFQIVNWNDEGQECVLDIMPLMDVLIICLHLSP